MERDERKYASLTMDLEDLDEFASIRNKGRFVFPSVMDGFDAFLDLLDRYSIRATFFVLSSRIEQDEERISKLLEKGHEIALHGKDHVSMKEKSEEEAIRDMLEAKKAIEEKFSISLQGNRFPGWMLPQKAAHVLEEVGLCYDATFTPTSPHFPTSGTKEVPEGFHLNSWGVYSSAHQTEFPMPVGKALGFHQAMLGGGPLLRFPTTKQFHEFLSRALNQPSPFVFYCHPFEFSSTKIPLNTNLSPLERYYLTTGRKRYIKRVEELIQTLLRLNYVILPLKEIVEAHSNAK